MSELKSAQGLQRIFEFATFKRATVHVSNSPSSSSNLKLRIVDMNEETFAAEPLGEITAQAFNDLASGRSVIGHLPYKRQFLQFETQSLGVKEGVTERKVLLFKKPTSATIANRRNYYRFPLADSTEQIEARLMVEALGRKTVFETSLMGSISNVAISLYLPREKGMILPKDAVSSLSLRINGEEILSTQGAVLRVAPTDRHILRSDHYLAVVAFKQEPMEAKTQDKDRRVANRIYLLDKGAAFIQCKHPLLPTIDLKGPIVDLSTTGLSFLVETEKAPMVPGTTLKRVNVQLPLSAPEQVDLRIVSTRRVHQGMNEFIRTNCEITNASSSALRTINQLILSHNVSNVGDAAADDYDSLWEFLFETGFIYGEKRKQLQAYAEQTFDTYRKLLSQPNSIAKKIVFKEKDGIKGHISTIRFFDNAWLIQHLNALKSQNSASAAKAVLNAIVQFFLDAKANQMSGTNFVACYYRPDNLYPTLVFGEAHRIIDNPDICSLRDLEYCTLESTVAALPKEQTSGEIRVREATKDDLLKLEEFLVESSYHNELRVEGLTSTGATHLAISDAFRALGLYRERKVMVSEHHSSGGRLYAVCNLASPGLNLSELTNSVRFFFTTTDASIREALAHSMGPALMGAYAGRGMDRPVLLLEKGQPIPPPFTRGKTYRYWILSTDHVAKFKVAYEQTFANMKELIKRHTEHNADSRGK